MSSDCNLESISTFISRGIAPKYTETSENSILVINQKCIRDFQVTLEQARLNDLSKQKVTSDKLLQKFDVLVNSTGVGTLGRVAQYFGEKSSATVDSHVTIVRPDISKVDPLFFGYLIKNKQSEIEGFAQGTTGQTELSRESLKSLNLRLLDDLRKQEFVGNCLKALDDKIELNNQINQTLEAMAQAIFKSWFVDFEPVKAKMAVLQASGTQAEAELAAMMAISGKTAEQLSTMRTTQPEAYQQLTQTAALFPAAMQESELGEIPEGWIAGAFKDCCSRVESGGTPSRKQPAFWGGEIPWLSSGEVRDVVILDTKEKITLAGLTSSNAKLWPAMTTVVAMYGATAGQVGLIAQEMTANQACCALIPNKEYKAFIFIAARESIQELADKASGSAQQNLNKSLIENHQHIIPNREIAEKFEVVTGSILEQWILNQRTAGSLAQTRDSLLPKLLSGEIDLSHLEETAA